MDTVITQGNVQLMTFTKFWCHYTVYSTNASNKSNIQTFLILLFVNSNKDGVIYTLTVKEIAEAQQDNPILQFQALANKD